MTKPTFRDFVQLVVKEGKMPEMKEQITIVQPEPFKATVDMCPECGSRGIGVLCRINTFTGEIKPMHLHPRVYECKTCGFGFDETYNKINE